MPVENLTSVGEARFVPAPPARPAAVSVSPESRATVSPDELRPARLFDGVADEELATVLDRCKVKHLNVDGLLIRPGEVDDRLFVVLRGRLRVHLLALDEEPIAFVGVGESVGEMSLIDSSPRSAYVVADQPATLLEVSHAAFWSLASSSPHVPINLLHIMASRVRGNNTAISESRRLQQLYKRHASVDALTGLHNRRWLDDVLPRQMKRSVIQGEPVCVAMIDVDHFKRYNDAHGHQAGDFVLFAVAHVLKTCLRPTDLVARYGGEEFTIILPNTDLLGAQAAGERVRRAIERTDLVTPAQTVLPSVTVSIGLAQLSSEEAPQRLVERADAALYRAKRGGRNQVRTAPVEPISKGSSRRV